MFNFLKRTKKSPTLGQPQTLGNRISNILRANIHAALDAAENPEEMLNQFVRDFTTNIQEAESAVAGVIGNLRLLESTRHDTSTEVVSWNNKVVAASDRADQCRDAGNSSEASRYDQLATVALTRQIAAEKKLETLDPQIESQSATTEQLKNSLSMMREKLTYLTTKRDELISRAKVAQAQTLLVDAVSSINTSDPTSELSGFEHQVRQQEALVRGRAEVAASSFDTQFDELEALVGGGDAQNRLAALKADKNRPKRSLAN